MEAQRFSHFLGQLTSWTTEPPPALPGSSDAPENAAPVTAERAARLGRVKALLEAGGGGLKDDGGVPDSDKQPLDGVDEVDPDDEDF